MQKGRLSLSLDQHVISFDTCLWCEQFCVMQSKESFCCATAITLALIDMIRAY